MTMSITGRVRSFTTRFTLLVAALAPCPLLAADAPTVDFHDTRMLAQPAMSGRQVAFSYDNDIWIADLGSPSDASRVARGELLPGLDRVARYKLGRYPQSEREFAKHFRISTFMMKDFASLEEIAEASGAALADVVDYVNAYTAVGFVENDRVRYDATDARGKLRNPYAR